MRQMKGDLRHYSIYTIEIPAEPLECCGLLCKIHCTMERFGKKNFALFCMDNVPTFCGIVHKKL
jgi:hypothetical protein